MTDFNFCFRQDLLQLLNSFYQLKSYRYSDFVDTWNQLKFYQIFSIQRFFPIEYRFLMKDVFKITVEYFYDANIYPEVRTGSLYTLYGLYAGQMNRPRLKIPVTPIQWIEILKFIEAISQAEHVDVEYAFRYLVHSDAFEFCSQYEIKNEISGLKVGNQPKQSKINTDEKSGGVKAIDPAKFNEAVFTDDINEQIGTIHEAYLQCKDDINKSGAITKLATYINTDFKNLIGEDVLRQLEKSQNKLEKDREVLDVLSSEKRAIEENDSSSQEEDDNDDEEESEKPTTSKKANSSHKANKRTIKSKFNRNFQSMFLDADETDEDEDN